MSPRPVVIVEAAANGKHFPDEFKKYGIPTIHVKMREDRKGLEMCGVLPEDSQFQHVFVYQGSTLFVYQGSTLNDLVEKLKPLNPFAVVPGIDFGVKLADRLSNALGLACSNDLGLSSARLDKYYMQEALKEYGLDHTKQISSSDFNEIKKWVGKHGYPVFVKPKYGAASVGNRICEDEEDLQEAYEFLKNPLTPLMEEEKDENQLLVQELIDGEQYCVNFTSWQGEHYLYDIWKYIRKPQKDGGYVFYQYRMLPCRDADKEAAMIAYCQKALDATGFKFGASHIEVIYVEGRGPVLVEINPRPRGTFMEKDIHESGLGYTQPGMAALAYTDTEKFKSLDHPTRFRANKYIVQTLLHMHSDGKLGEVKGLELAQTLPSFERVAYKGYQKGMPVTKTIDESCFPGCIYLVHEDLDQIRKDADQMLEWQLEEKVGFFVD